MDIDYSYLFILGSLVGYVVSLSITLTLDSLRENKRKKKAREARAIQAKNSLNGLYFITQMSRAFDEIRKLEKEKESSNRYD